MNIALSLTSLFAAARSRCTSYGGRLKIFCGKLVQAKRYKGSLP